MAAYCVVGLDKKLDGIGKNFAGELDLMTAFGLVVTAGRFLSDALAALC